MIDLLDDILPPDTEELRSDVDMVNKKGIFFNGMVASNN